MAQRRVEAFFALVEEYRTEAGFLGFRAMNILQNIAMSELQNWLGNEKEAWSSPWENQFGEFFKTFDGLIRKIFEKLQPEKFVLLSDHGAVPFRQRLNVNALLKNAGFQRDYSNVAKFRNRLRNAVSRRMTRLGLSGLKKNYFDRLDLSRTRAFNFEFIPGVFLNDSRFGGPVLNDRESEDLRRSVCQLINDSNELQSQNITAEPYRLNHLDRKYSDMLPDIWIHKPDETMMVDTGPLLSLNPWYGPIEAVANLPQSVFTGLKGRYPLLLHTSQNGINPPKGKTDQTLAYQRIRELVESS